MILKLIVFLLSVQSVISALWTLVEIEALAREQRERFETHFNYTLETVCTSFMSPIDTLSYGAIKTPIFKNKSYILAQPVIIWDSCPTMYRSQSEYYLELKVRIDFNPLITAGRTNFSHGTVGNFITDGIIQIGYVYSEKYPFYDLDRHSSTFFALFAYIWVTVYCETLERCHDQWELISTNISELEAFKVYIAGFPAVNEKNQYWVFNKVSTSVPPEMNCSWKLVQSFNDLKPETWETHVNGVGKPWQWDRDHWIGLAALHLITDRKDRPQHKCKLRIELEDWQGNRYWGQWNQFQVMAAEDNYRVKVGEVVEGTLINGLEQYRNMRLTNYSDDSYFNETDYNDYVKYFWNHLSRYSSSKTCSARYMNVGWWFNSCFNVSINGNHNAPDTKGDAKFRWVPMKRSEMTVNCG